MKLGGKAILDQFSTGNWSALRGDTPIPVDELEVIVGPNSVDVTLHPTLLAPVADWVVNPRDAASLAWRPIEIPAEGYVLQPREFLLGAVRERFVCSRQAPLRDFNVDRGDATQRFGLFAPMYEGRSTCGRLGLASHVTAGFGDYGFSGSFTLEIVNHAPFGIRLFPGMRIGQVAFEHVVSPKLYQGAYSAGHNDGPVPPQLGPTRF
jgi:deoxycytidine triphosphate deaminase